LTRILYQIGEAICTALAAIICRNKEQQVRQHRQ